MQSGQALYLFGREKMMKFGIDDSFCSIYLRFGNPNPLTADNNVTRESLILNNIYLFTVYVQTLTLTQIEAIVNHITCTHKHFKESIFFK